MPQQRPQTSILAKFKDRADRAVQETVGKPFVAANQGVLPGIHNGVARLLEMKWDTVAKKGENEGKPFFQARAVVIEPEQVEYPAGSGQMVTVRGMTTRQYVQIEDDPSRGKTVEDCFAKVANVFKCCGHEFEGGEDLEALADHYTAMEDKPYFRLTTKPKQKKDERTGEWYDDPDGGVTEFWNGQVGLEGYVPPDPAGAVRNGTAGHAPRNAPVKSASPPARGARTNGKAAPQAPEAPAAKFRPGAKPAPAQKSTPPKKAPGPDGDGLDELAALANDGDEDAMAKINALAQELGIFDDPAFQEASFPDVPDMLRKAREGAATPGAALLEVGNVVGWQPDPKKAAVQCEVVKLNGDGTATLREVLKPKVLHASVTEAQVVEWIPY